MTNTKMTKRELFNLTKSAINGDLVLSAEQTDKLNEFIDHELDLLNRKRSTGKSKSNEKQVALMEKVFQALETETEKVTVSTLLVRHPEQLTDPDHDNMVMSNQKCSAMLKKLVDLGKVEKVVEKKVSFFKIAE